MQVTLPPFARKAEHTFLLGAFLKIMLLATVVPTNKIFKPLGEHDRPSHTLTALNRTAAA